MLRSAWWYFRPIFTLEDGPIVCPETSVRNYHHALRNIPEGRRYYLPRCRSLKSRIIRRFCSAVSTCTGTDGTPYIGWSDFPSTSRPERIFLYECLRKPFLSPATGRQNR